MQHTAEPQSSLNVAVACFQLALPRLPLTTLRFKHTTVIPFFAATLSSDLDLSMKKNTQRFGHTGKLFDPRSLRQLKNGFVK